MAREPAPSDDVTILNEIIADIRARIKEDIDPDERNKLYDRLLKAVGMRRKESGGKKGRGFDLK